MTEPTDRDLVLRTRRGQVEAFGELVRRYQVSVFNVCYRMLGDLSQGLAAVHADLADFHSRLTVVVMTEFGRRVQENASLGTDHGHGSLMLLFGGNVLGGQVHGLWPGLEQDQLFGPGDLAATTDYRDVLTEVCRFRLNNPAISEIFPDYQPQRSGFVRKG